MNILVANSVTEARKMLIQRVRKTVLSFSVVISLLVVTILSTASIAYAQDSFVVDDIRIEGLQRITPGTAFNYVSVKVGDRFDDALSIKVIRDLYKTGFFKNVRIDQKGNDLVIVVDENPSIDSITTTGNKAFNNEILDGVLSENGLAQGEIYSPNVLDDVVKELKAQYLNIGKYNAKVQLDAQNLPRNRVALALNIREGKTAKIKKITIIGNKYFSNKEILSRFTSRTNKGLNPFSKANQYSKDKVTGDIETLRSMYQNEGFVDFEIVSSRVSISPQKDGVFLTLNVNEGARFKVSQFTLNGRLILPETDLLPLVSIRPGEYYSRADVDSSIQAISEKLADEGYASARILPVPEFNRDESTVAFRININPGKVVYVRRIDISGNEKTNSEVIRRELRQLEGAALSPSAVQRSRTRLNRLGFFDEVDIKTTPVPGKPDQVDLAVSVKEAQTGNFLFGVGYSEGDGLILQIQTSQNNFLGTGKSVRFSADTTGSSDSVNIGYTDPYITDSGISRSVNFEVENLDSAEADTSDFLTETIGLNVLYRFPLGEDLSFSLGGGVEKIELISTDSTAPEIAPFIEQFPENTQFNLNTRLTYDTRDSLLYTTSGSNNRLGLDIAVPGSDLEFYKLSLSSAYYLQLTERSAFKLGGEVSIGDGYGDTDGLPFYENFYAGGANTVRGYAPRSLGPRDSSEDQDPLGGDKRLLLNASLLLPMPGSDSKSQRFSLFVEGGQVFGADDSIDVSSLRWSAGLGFNWITPVGPLSLSYAIPINDEDGDDVDRIQFSIGRLLQ